MSYLLLGRMSYRVGFYNSQLTLDIRIRIWNNENMSKEFLASDRQYAPYKMLTHLLWGQYTFAKWREGRVRFSNVPLAKHFGFHPNRVKHYVTWLESHGIIDNVKREYGVTSFRVVIPEPFKKMGMTVKTIRGGKDA